MKKINSVKEIKELMRGGYKSRNGFDFCLAIFRIYVKSENDITKIREDLYNLKNFSYRYKLSFDGEFFIKIAISKKGYSTYPYDMKEWHYGARGIGVESNLISYERPNELGFLGELFEEGCASIEGDIFSFVYDPPSMANPYETKIKILRMPTEEEAELLRNCIGLNREEKNKIIKRFKDNNFLEAGLIK